MPTRSTEQAAGYDLTFTTCQAPEDLPYVEYGTGIATAIPEGYVGLLFPRSSISKTGLIMANCVGVIDSDYRGEIKARFKQIYTFVKSYRVGEKGCQLIIMEVPAVAYEEYPEEEFRRLFDTKRGEGGFGSTGK